MKRILLSCLLGWSVAAAAEPATIDVHACGGANEWPPSSYYLRRDGRTTGEVAGFSPDVLAAALQGSRFRPQVALLPFARCLADARAGHTMQIVMAAFHTAQRAEAFFYSEPYLQLMPRAWFLASQWPKGLALSSLRDLGSYRLCGLNGISYAHLGPVAAQVYTGVSDYGALVRMLEAGRCDVFVESQEVINGFRLLGAPELAGSLLASAAVPEVEPLQAHLMVSRRHPQAHRLVEAINAGLQRLKREQRLAPLLQKHQAAP